MSSDNKDEQTFNILPHPAKTNDPKDLNGPQLGAGLNNKPEFSALNARGPHVPNADVIKNMEAPLSREELKKRQEEINK